MAVTCSFSQVDQLVALPPVCLRGSCPLRFGLSLMSLRHVPYPDPGICVNALPNVLKVLADMTDKAVYRYRWHPAHVVKISARVVNIS